jgi:hypothetical protein
VQEKARRAKLNSKYIVLESRKDGTKFTSKKMKDYANAIFEHTQAYSKIQSDLLGSVLPAPPPDISPPCLLTSPDIHSPLWTCVVPL